MLGKEHCYLNPTTKDVFDAVKSGEVDQLGIYGKDVLLDARDDEDLTPFLAAVRRGSSATVSYLVGLLGDTCLRDTTEDGMTCLHLASERGCGSSSGEQGDSAVAMLRFLLGGYKERPELPHVDARDSQKFTPLHVACMGGDLDAARYLLRNGSNTEAQNSRGSTPLHWACSRGHTKVGRGG